MHSPKQHKHKNALDIVLITMRRKTAQPHGYPFPLRHINIMSKEIVTSEQDQQEAERILHNAELMALLVDWLFIGREDEPPKGPPN